MHYVCLAAPSNDGLGRQQLLSGGDSDVEELADNVRQEMNGDNDSMNPGCFEDLFLSTTGSGTMPSSSGSAQGSSRKRATNVSNQAPAPKIQRKSGPNWAILEHIWPALERPEALRDHDWIEKQSIGDLMQLHKVYLKKEQKEQGQAIGRATKDSRPPVQKLEEGEDDCDKQLHDARFLRMPISRPKHWYHKIPVKHNHSYRNIPVRHVLGMDSAVAPAVVLARHDRKNALQLKHYNRSNANITSKPMKEIKSRDSVGVSTISDYDWVLPNNVRQCQDSILIFAAVNRSLWPYDYTDIALTRVYNRYDWCGAAHSESD